MQCVILLASFEPYHCRYWLGNSNMDDVDGFRDTDDGIMTRLWDWYTNPPCGNEDNDDSEEFIRSIQVGYSSVLILH